MNWNEKIDLLKKHYPAEEFSVPHVDRKRILRQIETQFINRPWDYYELNKIRESYSNWWENIKATLDLTIETNYHTSNYYTFLNVLIDPTKHFWIACESPGEILIYKSKLKAATNLIAIGQTWVDTFHIIELKYEYLVSLRIEKNTTRIKASANQKFEERIKLATTPR